MEDSINSMYALKTSVGQEKNVARMLARKVKDSGIEINAILIPESLKGYVLVESSSKIDMQNPAIKVPHLRGIVEGKNAITFDEVKKILKTRTNNSFYTKRKYSGVSIWPFQRRKGKSGSY